MRAMLAISNAMGYGIIAAALLLAMIPFLDWGQGRLGALAAIVALMPDCVRAAVTISAATILVDVPNAASCTADLSARAVRCCRERRLILVLLLLVGGALVNVAVAWGIAYAFRTRVEFPGSYSLGGIPLWGITTDVEQGWPVHSLATQVRVGSGHLRQDAIGGVELGRYPLWPGFAINTVFYAVVLWLLFAGPFVLRRRRRIRRGLCPKCAYDLRGRGSDGGVCPECGTPQALPRKVETSTSPNVQRNDSTIEP